MGSSSFKNVAKGLLDLAWLFVLCFGSRLWLRWSARERKREECEMRRMSD